jgi:lysophospholipase L1-like esterase
MAVLEKYEWSDMWWDEPDEKGRRILLVGDSITRSYRQPLKDLAGDGLYIDMFATSRAVDNPTYIRELSCMMSNSFAYKIIHLNNGLHGFHQSIETYAEWYECLINFFLAASGNAALILALSTPVTIPGSPQQYGEKNDIVLERNEAVRRLAEKYRLPLDDLYTAADNNKKVKSEDGIHFTGEGCRLLAGQVFKALSSIL